MTSRQQRTSIRSLFRTSCLEPRILTIGLSLSTLLMSGCGGGTGIERAEVKGVVTFNGEPVNEGTITLIPDEGNKSPGSGEKIENGAYFIDRAKGPPPGKYLVQILGRRKTGKEIPAGPPAPEGATVPEIEQYIPAQYNTNTTLKIDVVSGQNTHDFHLTPSGGG